MPGSSTATSLIFDFRTIPTGTNSNCSRGSSIFLSGIAYTLATAVTIMRTIKCFDVHLYLRLQRLPLPAALLIQHKGRDTLR